MPRTIGTVSRGIRAPMIREGDDMAAITVQAVLEAAQAEGFTLRERDVVGVTEAVVARAQGNYATAADISQDVRAKLGGETIGVLFPILSRNRFAICLRGIASGAKKVVLMLSYPSDEVGNHLMDPERLDAAGINPFTDVLTEARFRELFDSYAHPFTGVDYIDYYMNIIREAGAQAMVLFGNNPAAILPYADHVLCCDIHTRHRTKRLLKAAGAECVYGLDEILQAPVTAGGGFNPDYGLLGSNKATEDSVKLFPRDCDRFVEQVRKLFLEATGKHIEVLIYGDGAFKDPVGKIWELADPVVSPAYTAGLEGTPNELKIKYLADNEFAALSGDALKTAIEHSILHKQGNLLGQMASEGTTPRRLTDLIGSLCDLTSGSGDKGTPIILIQGYFDHYAN